MNPIPSPRGIRPILASRVVFLALLGSLLAATALLAAAPVEAATDPVAQAVRTIAQDLRGATFEVVPGPARFDTANVGGVVYSRVSVRGAVMVEVPGRPALPTMTLHVAVPDGMSPRLRVTAEEWDDRAASPPVPVAQQRFVSDDPKTGPVSEFRTVPEAAIYRGAAVYPADAALLGPGAALVGEWWVAPVHVRPVRWDPRSGTYRVLRKMTLRVDFVPATERELSTRPATRPGAQARAWDRVQRGLVGNYEAARAFPARPRAGSLGAPPRGGFSRSRMAVNPEWKLSVAQTGWVSVSYATLAASGFPSNIDIANVRVEERGYDDTADTATVTPIPVVARDAGVTGKFDAGDVITFYARSIRDRFGLGNIELRYSDVNVYWLTWGSTPAATPGTVSGNIPGSATIPTSFRDVIRLEENHAAMMAPNNSIATPPEAVEYLFWTDGFDGDQLSVPIPFVDPDATQPFRIRSRFQGSRITGLTHLFDVFYQGPSGVPEDTLAFQYEFRDQEVWLLDSGFTIPGSHIGSGGAYRYVGQRITSFGAPPIDGSFANLDVIEVTYSRLYRARGNILHFTSGEVAGLVELHIGGFTGAAIEVYDVTNPVAPLAVTSTSVTGSGPYDVVFRTDATSGVRRFVAMVTGAETNLSGSVVVADAASNLRQPGGFAAGSLARSILIAPGAFMAEADRLANYRREQRYVVEVADVADVYDEFNGGIKSARALRRYLRHAYLAWTPRPTFVLLAGDGSLDYRKHLEGSSVDWVPSYLRFEEIFGNFGRELVAQDTYYSLNLSVPLPAPADFVPSVSIARIPASSAGELRSVVDKIIAYENFQPTDSWRGRQLLFSDDEFSTGISFAQAYCFQPQEVEFRTASGDMATITATSPGGIDVTNDFYDLKTYTAAIPPPTGCKSQQAVLTELATGGGYDALIAEINQGSLIFNLETHGNRYLIAHEALLVNGNFQFTPNSPNTPDRIQNVGRPFYGMVWGCHTNQFADGHFYSRQVGSVDSSDALGEQWLLMPGRGSIGSLGSTALEFLQTNHVYNNFTADAFYTTPPAPPPPPGEPPQARWILGEVMLVAQVRNGLTGGSSFDPQPQMNRTIHLFADPMLRMDALPPRVYQVTVAGNPFPDNTSLTTDSPTDSSSLVADLRDEVGIDSVYLTEQDLASGAVSPLDTLSYSVAFSDSSRLATLTTSVRPRAGNYDLQIRAVDINGRLQIFTLQIRTPIRYLADGVEIVNNVFVAGGARLRAEVTSPIPLTADSLQLVVDGAVVASTKTKLDTAGRLWALEASPSLTTGTHTIQVAIGGRTAGFEQRTFQTTTQFTIRGVAVVDPRMQGTGCGGSVFQYELSAAARDVELLILTVAGRRVASIPMPSQAGLNTYCWDGRDARSHDTAQGVYFYRLRATDTSGKTVSHDGRMIRAR